MDCRKTRTYQQRTNQTDFFELFRQYILWGFTYKALSSLSGYSIQYLSQKFHEYLKHEPPSLPLVDQSKQDEAYLLIDGLWFGRWFVLLVYRQSKNLTILHISTMKKEVTSKISKDLEHLTDLGYRFSGVISDGGTGIVGAIMKVFPNMPHQHCLAHMHRRIVAALGKYPRDERLKQLKHLADWVWLIESSSALKYWHQELKTWVNRNISFLREYREDTTGRTWFVHTGARKATRMLLSLPNTSFVFLTHHLMPKTTNEIEAQFGHIGRRWIAHTGLKEDRWEDFLKWFVYFYNQEKLAASNKKKAAKNHTLV